MDHGTFHGVSLALIRVESNGETDRPVPGAFIYHALYSDVCTSSGHGTTSGPTNEERGGALRRGFNSPSPLLPYPTLPYPTVCDANMDDLTVQESTPSAGKSLRFKLAFIGLASIDFVFQFDATALGVALPVRRLFPLSAVRDTDLPCRPLPKP